MPVTLVCGAGGALGRALVDAFRARGDDVIGVDRSAAPRDGVRMEAADLTDPDAVEELWDRIETPQWVVNAVGGYRGARLADTEADALRFLFALNVETTFWSCRAAARRLRPGSAIVNVAARAAVSGGTGAAAYAASKAAVVRLTEVAAAELDGVRVNAVLPLLIDTPANRAVMSADALKNAVAPERIAAVCAFLCSDAAGPITGASLPV
ncbi:MAG: SDR family oxidoreductase [Actinobacteria bacterium]|nr:SDR family oxidoreductase [Actinomycetota bacterium]MBV8394975.1 SDR family oxidoreductase [Actinomycetota bacterium]